MILQQLLDYFKANIYSDSVLHIVVALNKADKGNDDNEQQQQRQHTIPATTQLFCNDHKLDCFLTSAKDNINVDALFQSLITKVDNSYPSAVQGPPSDAIPYGVAVPPSHICLIQ